MGMKEFNKQIRQKLYPVLREIGFEQIGNRNSLIWKADVIYRLQIKAGWQPFQRCHRMAIGIIFLFNKTVLWFFT